MAQDPLNVLWVEPHFPGRLGAVADWLVRRRGYRCWFYCHTVDVPDRWPESVGRGLDVVAFKVGGVAREPAVAWQRILERGLCHAYGCWEVLESNRPRPVDLIVGRSAGLGSTLFAPVSCPGAPVVNYFDYYYHAHAFDLADDAGPETPTAYTQWRRSANVIDLLDLENADARWVPTHWQRDLFPAEYRDDLAVLHEGIDTRRFSAEGRPTPSPARARTVLGRTVPAGTKVVTFVARALDRLRGFDRFLRLARLLLAERSDVVCVAVGERIVQRGLDVAFHQRDYAATLLAEGPLDPARLWLPGRVSVEALAELFAATDLHVAPTRRYPVARSVLEALASGCVVLASDVEPVREFITPGATGLLARPDDPDDWVRQARAVLDDPDGHAPLGVAAAESIRASYSQDATLPRLAEWFGQWADRS